MPQIVNLITQKEGYDDITAIGEFYQSKVYDLLEVEETKCGIIVRRQFI